MHNSSPYTHTHNWHNCFPSFFLQYRSSFYPMQMLPRPKATPSIMLHIGPLNALPVAEKTRIVEELVKNNGFEIEWTSVPDHLQSWQFAACLVSGPDDKYGANCKCYNVVQGWPACIASQILTDATTFCAAQQLESKTSNSCCHCGSACSSGCWICKDDFSIK